MPHESQMPRRPRSEEVPCPDCGATVPPGALLCRWCGAWRPTRNQVRATVPLTAPSRSRGDHRVLLRAALIIAALGAAGAVLQTAREVIAARAPTVTAPAAGAAPAPQQ
jgi:ribosomal protein L40E